MSDSTTLVSAVLTIKGCTIAIFVNIVVTIKCTVRPDVHLFEQLRTITVSSSNYNYYYS